MRFFAQLGQILRPTLQQSPAELEAETTRREELSRLIERKLTYDSFQRHIGWEMFDKELTARRAQLIENVLRETEVAITKAKITELDAVLRIVPDAIREGQNAQAELDGYNHE